MLDFLDAVHAEIKSLLEGEFGPRWIQDGVKKHCGAEYFDRTQAMLTSPMRVVDMGKSSEEMYGVEHLRNIISGNWKLFRPIFSDKTRVEAALSEIAEVRNNLSHRRSAHILKGREVLRLTENCRIILSALRNPLADRFDSFSESISHGINPWGIALAGDLPDSYEVVRNFVGRPSELGDLSTWLMGKSPQVLVFGYGGAGKSATAYEFARQVQDRGFGDLQAVCWSSAKRLEFVQGEERDRTADFSDIKSLASSVTRQLYGVEGEDPSGESLLRELTQTPCLVVLDDLDTILSNDKLAEFILFELRKTRSRFIFTSRNKVPGIQTVEIPGLSSDDLESYIGVQARELGLNVSECKGRQDVIANITGAYPLFVADLLRYSRLVGFEKAIQDWQQRKGDAARAYALRRQLEQLSRPANDALLALSISSHPLSGFEIATISGAIDDDVERAIQDLESWRLVSPVQSDGSSETAFAVNANTRRLVLKTQSKDSRIETFRNALRSFRGDNSPPAMQMAIGSVFSICKSYLLRQDFDGAINCVKLAMTGELANSADLYGLLGKVYSKMGAKFVKSGREAFEAGHQNGSRNPSMYYEWANMECHFAETPPPTYDFKDVSNAWAKVQDVCRKGIQRCGESHSLCQMLCYALTRRARCLDRLGRFSAAQSDYLEGRRWGTAALRLPVHNGNEYLVGRAHRSLLHAELGIGKDTRIAGVLNNWFKEEGNTELLADETRKACERHPSVRKHVSFQP